VLVIGILRSNLLSVKRGTHLPFVRKIKALKFNVLSFNMRRLRTLALPSQPAVHILFSEDLLRAAPPGITAEAANLY